MSCQCLFLVHNYLPNTTASSTTTTPTTTIIYSTTTTPTTTPISSTTTAPTTSLVTAGSCPAGWSELEGECYKYFDDWPITWDAAREHCLGEEVKCQEIKDNFYQISISYHQADLASVHSERENQFLAQLSSGQRTWLGGRRSCSGCEDFVWSDGTSLGFTNWWPGEPVRFIFESPPKHSLFIKGFPWGLHRHEFWERGIMEWYPMWLARQRTVRLQEIKQRWV